MYNVELSKLNQGNKLELQKSIESILEIMMALNEETVEKWIKEKYPNGIGLYEVIDSQPVRREPSHHEKAIEADLRLQKPCPKCYSMNNPGYKYCHKYGAKMFPPPPP